VKTIGHLALIRINLQFMRLKLLRVLTFRFWKFQRNVAGLPSDPIRFCHNGQILSFRKRQKICCLSGLSGKLLSEGACLTELRFRNRMPVAEV